MKKNIGILLMVLSMIAFVGCEEMPVEPEELTKSALKGANEPDGSNNNLDSVEVGFIADIDGNVYQTVEIGDQTWMAENLRVTHYPDGTPIPTTLELLTGEDPADYHWSYNYEEYNDDTWGKYYTYTASQNVCPEGWRVPTREDIYTLAIFVGEDPDTTTIPSEDYKLSYELRTADLQWWKNIDNVTNEVNFNARGSGAYYPYSESPYFARLRYATTYWLQDTMLFAFSWANDDSPIQKGYLNNELNSGFSVRCVKD